MIDLRLHERSSATQIGWNKGAPKTLQGTCAKHEINTKGASIKGVHQSIKSIARERVEDQQEATGERPARGERQPGKTARAREGLKKAQEESDYSMGKGGRRQRTRSWRVTKREAQAGVRFAVALSEDRDAWGKQEV
jgi:hypothetical protein